MLSFHLQMEDENHFLEPTNCNQRLKISSKHTTARS